MAGGFFKWAAPLFAREGGSRRAGEDAAIIAGWLAPYVGEKSAVLDLGGGTGGLAIRLAGTLDVPITVYDASPEMLSYVPADPRVKAVQGRAEKMPFADASFDAAVVSDAFHHMVDQDAATRELARVVRSGGAVLVLEQDREAPWMWVALWGERILGEPASFLTPDELVAFMAERGIEGTVTSRKGSSYSFLGVVRRG